MELRELNRAFDQFSPTQEQKEAIRARLLHAERKRRPMKWMKKTIAVAAAAHMLGLTAEEIAAGFADAQLPPQRFARSRRGNWDIVDFVCRMPGGTKVQMGNYDSILALSSLRYFAWFVTNSLQDMTDMFSYCTSLLSVRALDTTSVTDMTGTFYNCSTLRAIPAMDTSNVTSLPPGATGPLP